MWCKEEKEYVSYKTCEECIEDHGFDRSDGMPLKQCEAYEKEIEKQKKLDQFRSSDFMMHVNSQLSKMLGLEVGEIERIINSLSNEILSQYQVRLDTLIKDRIDIMVCQYMDYVVKKQLDEIFEKNLNDQITVISEKDDVVMQTSIKEKMLKLTKEYFNFKDRNNRTNMENSLNTIMENRINKMCDEALKELKKETIEKFNTEAMKSMMKGMAKQLGSDKKLMKILTSEDFE